MQDDNEPKGVGFFRISTGETLYVKSDPQIQAMINSSDMGINASRGQDFKWRLAPDWVEKVKQFRRNEAKMERLTEKNGGKKVSTAQVLYAIYGEELRVSAERAEENETPFEEQYQKDISGKSEAAEVKKK
jgi:hypothetical protein